MAPWYHGTRDQELGTRDQGPGTKDRTDPSGAPEWPSKQGGGAEEALRRARGEPLGSLAGRAQRVHERQFDT